MMHYLAAAARAWVGGLVVALLIAGAILLLASGLFEKVALAIGIVGVAVVLAALLPTRRKAAASLALTIIVGLVVIAIQEVTR